MRIKTFIIIAIIYCFNTLGYSQSFDILDTIFPRPQVIGMDTYSYLIKDDTLYEFSVEYIFTLKNGFVLQLRTTIDTTNIVCFAVSPKGIDNSGVAIKKGQKYWLLLKRYNLIPARAGIESFDVADFLLGGRLVSVNENGLYKYMFYSPMLSGNRIKSMSNVEQGNSEFAKDSLSIAVFTQSFINIISKKFTKEQLYSVIDPKSMKTIMGKYSVHIQGRSPSDLGISTCKKHSWDLDAAPPKYYSRRTLRRESTYQLFCKMLDKEYVLSLEQESTDYANILNLQLLYSCKSLYTIRVIWENASFKKKYVAVFDIEKRDNGFIIKHFNKPYQGYRLYIKENNQRFVPLIK